MKIYTYPRVTTSVTALTRTSRRPAPEDTTVLFVPIIGETGPAREIVKIHSLEEYVSTFGVDKRMGLTLLNVSNWLTAGGTVYAYRLCKLTKDLDGVISLHDSVKKAVASIKYQPMADKENIIELTAKYYGSAVNNYTVKAMLSGRILTLKLFDSDNNERERLNLSANPDEKSSFTEIEYDLSGKSQYLGSVKFSIQVVNKKIVFKNSSNRENLTLKFENVDGTPLIDGSDIKYFSSIGSDGWTGAGDLPYYTALRAFWGIDADESKEDLMLAIGNHLETPIDLIMDAGYPVDIKKGMIAAISSVDNTGEENSIRSDIRGIFDLGNLEINIDSDTIAGTLWGENNDAYKKTSNVFLFNQWMLISEETYFGKDMVVYPSYFLSKLIPENDLTNGIQFPVAGKRRGELEGIKKLSENPVPDTKEEWFKARVNYIEKDSRGYYFMSQRTFDGSTDEKYTALSFMNNSRVTCKMVHELERLGRDYLFEFNDAITIGNMSNVLNRYVTNWISNRTLTWGYVEVTPDEYSDERVNAVLNIKFAGTIEVISIDLILH